jgi:hypothetical protein
VPVLAEHGVIDDAHVGDGPHILEVRDKKLSNDRFLVFPVLRLGSQPFLSDSLEAEMMSSGPNGGQPITMRIVLPNAVGLIRSRTGDLHIIGVETAPNPLPPQFVQVPCPFALIRSLRDQ